MKKQYKSIEIAEAMVRVPSSVERMVFQLNALRRLYRVEQRLKYGGFKNVSDKFVSDHSSGSDSNIPRRLQREV